MLVADLRSADLSTDKSIRKRAKKRHKRTKQAIEHTRVLGGRYMVNKSHFLSVLNKHVK